MLASWLLYFLFSLQDILFIISYLQSFQFSRKHHMCMVEGNICCLFWGSPKVKPETII